MDGGGRGHFTKTGMGLVPCLEATIHSENFRIVTGNAFTVLTNCGNSVPATGMESHGICLVNKKQCLKVFQEQRLAYVAMSSSRV